MTGSDLALRKQKKPLKNPRIQANSLIEQIGSQQVSSLGDGPKIILDRVTEDEEVNAHNDFLHRYHIIAPASASYTQLYPLAGDPYYWLSSFRAYRGAVRILNMSISTVHDGLALHNSLGTGTTESYVSSGTYMQLNNTDIPVEIPYNNNVRFLPLRMTESAFLDAYDRTCVTNNITSSHTLWASGDDYTVGLRKAPAVVVLPVPP
jgi:hypothetical protein